MKNISIKWKIFSFLLLFSAALLTLLWLFQVVFLDSFYQSVKIHEMKAVATAVQKSLYQDDISHTLKSLSQNKDISIEVYSSSGLSIHSYQVGQDSILGNMSADDKAKLILKAKASKGEYLLPSAEQILSPSVDNILHQYRRQMHSMTMAKFIQSENGESFGLLISATISPIDATVGTLRTQLHYITVFMLLFSIVLALVIARRVSTPIEKLNAGAKLLAKGNYEVYFDGTGYLEIDELSDTLNDTAIQLAKVEKLRRELIANVSHDLRTPLTLIAGYAEIMRDLPGENNAENAQVIIDESKRLSFLVNDMLDLSKLQTDSEDLHRENYNLTASIQEMIHRLNELLRNDGYTIRLLANEEVFLYADKIKISQVIYNLLINAVNYTGNDKRVFIEQKLLKDSVQIKVHDSGKGIQPDLLPHIWERYYKSDTHQRPIAGSGLGLAIVKSLVEKHGGSYGVESMPDQGSTFWFSIPR